MFKIKTILGYGGSCPFQIDALTDDGRLIYGRYRRGYLRVYIGKTGDMSENAAVDGEQILGKKVGGEYDGYMALEEFKDHTKEVLDFSEVVDDN